MITSTKQRVILIGFNYETVKRILSFDNVIKLVIFDEDDEIRSDFESIYPFYKDRITLYDGAIDSNIDGYFKLRHDEGNEEMHMLFIY